MKRILFLAISVLLCLPANAQQGLSERIYLTTDRQVYVAGDMLYCSAFCFDAATGGLSDFSSIAYLELHSATSMVATAKVALVAGRGGSEFRIPAGTPTGNYVLLAYTAQNCNEDGYDYLTGARTISIFNTSSSERVKDGVEIVPAGEYKAAPAPGNEGKVVIGLPVNPESGKSASVSVRNAGRPVQLSVSVRHDDGIAAPATLSGKEFRASMKPGSSFSSNRIPEFEGEVIYGRVVGMNPAQADSLYGKTGFISAPGNNSDVYSSQINKDASITFFTNNIYGDKDLVCEIENLDSDIPCHLELDSPFVNAAVGEIPVLKMSNSLRDDLEKRSAYSNLEHHFASEMVPGFLPIRENALFGNEFIQYKLDDYTRFPTMEEVIVEFISEMRLRRTSERKRDIQVRLHDVYNSARYSNDAALMMIDGIPVFNYDRMLEYDPLLVESVNIYPYVYFVGTRSFEGIVNFVTYKRNMPAISFEPNVRIVEFRGCPYPSVYTGLDVTDNYPDYRQTAYWHPLVEIPENGEFSFDFMLPQYPGKFVIEVEGFDADGSPIYCSTEFTIE